MSGHQADTRSCAAYREGHAALALAAALQLPYVALRRERVVLDDVGRMTTAPDGALVRLSVKADYPAFRAWLGRKLDAALEGAR